MSDTSARGEESSEQSVLNGNAAKKIRPTLPLSTCYTNTRPEYAKYFVNLGVGKIRELCVLSRSLEFRNSIAQQVAVKSLPKWIPRQYIQVSSQVLLKRIAIVLKDTQPEVPIFSGTQNVQNQPTSGLNPHSTLYDPMTNRGGNHLQARQPRNRGPRIPKGRGRGYQGYQGQPGYQNYQYDQQPGNRSHSHFRGRGANRRGFNHTNMWANHHSGGHSTGQAPSASSVVGTPSVPTPSATPVIIDEIIDPNLTSGGSLFSRYMSKETFTKALHDRQRFRQTAGSSVKCALTSCTNQLSTGPGVKFCSACGSNQDTLEMAQYKEEIRKLQQQ